ncbi:MAG TPA: hypothetical protein VGX50_21155, partial [Longimicrobium sp.]|nr:hypothetical protein [Longimicrobium sp.]
EPLKAEARHFVECAGRGTHPRTDGRGALEVVRVLEAADRSLAAHGARVMMTPEPVRIAPPAQPARRRIRVPTLGPRLAATV